MINPEIWCALHALNADYWRRVDRLSDAVVDELYVDSGMMHIGSLRCEGRLQIRSFFVDRNDKEQAAKRTTRHIASALAIEELSACRFRIQSTVQVLSGNGELPLPSLPASTIGDFDDVVVLANGDFLFESRTARVVFVGANAAAFAR